jgi:hypothetical protein
MARLLALLLVLCSASAATDDVWIQFDAAVERLFQLKAKLVGARAAAALASSACRRDRERARAVFIRAMEHLKAADPSGAGGGLPVRGYLVRACGQCDPALARRLAATPGASIFDTFEDHLRRALNDASIDPERAAVEAQRAAPLLPWATDAQRTEFARMLLKLRRGSVDISNPDVADGAFSQILEILLEEPAEAVPSLFALGNYVLAPRPNDRDTVEPETVEGGGTAYSFRAERPSVPDELIVAYLESAVAALVASPPARATSASEALQREMLDRLRPFVAKWTAHMRAQFNSVARRLSVNELELTEDPPAPGTSTFTLSSFQREWTRGRGSAMRNLLTGLPNGMSRGQYETLVSFREAVQALEAREPELAAAIASGMPEGVHKILVHGGLPGQDSAFLFYREASRADLDVRPGLLLAAAQVLAQRAPDTAMTALLEAVKALNQWDRTRSSSAVRWENLSFIQPLGSARFRLTVPSMPLPDLRAAVAVLAPRDPSGVLALISNIQAEQRRASALVAWAEALLSRRTD